MWTLHTANDEHWVPISTVASFKRMRALQLPTSTTTPSSTTTPVKSSIDLPWLASQLRSKSTLVEVDSSGTQIRPKKDPSPPVDVFDRSVYAKGFGDDEKDGKLLSEIEEFLKKWGSVNAVRMRRDDEKKFKVCLSLRYPVM